MKKIISTILCGGLVVFSPGLGCYAALAGGFEAEAGGMDAVGALNMPVNASVGESLPNLNVENLGASGVNLPAGDLSRADLNQGAPAPEHAVPSVRAAFVEPSRPAVEPAAAPADAASAAEAISVQAAASRVSAWSKSAMAGNKSGGAQKGLSAQVAQGRVEFDLAAKTADASPVTAEIGAIKGTGAALGKPGSGDNQDDVLTAANLPGTYAIDVIRQGKSYKGRITFNENYTFTAEDAAGKSAQGDWTLELGNIYLRRAYSSDGGPTGIEIKIDVAGTTKSQLGKKGTALYMTLVSLASSRAPKDYWVIAKARSPSTDAVPAPGQEAGSEAAGFWKTLPDKILDIGVPFGRKSWKKRLIPIAAMAATAVSAAFMPRLFPIIGFAMLVMSGIGVTAILPGVADSKNKTGEYLANLAGMVLLVSLELTLAAGAGVILGALAYTPVAAHAVIALAPKAVAAAHHSLLSALAPVFGWSLTGGTLATVAGGIVFGTLGHFMKSNPTRHNPWGLGITVQARSAVLSMVAGALAGAFFGALHPAALPAVMAALAAHMTSARAALSAGRLAPWLLGGFVVSDLGAVAAQRVIEGKQALLTGRPASPKREALLDAVNTVLFYGIPVAAMALAGFLAGGVVVAATIAAGSSLGLALGDHLSKNPHAGPAIQYALLLGGVYAGALLAVHALLLI
ncbi:MAG TPA: hypothetical protein VNK24_01100 [Elusimicrobiota bacterium]|nr:hypothetical protein [Elusimicrobiota bacterium]